MRRDAVEARHVRVTQHHLAEGLIGAHLGCKALQQSHHAVRILARIDADGERSDRKVAGEVGDGRDLAVGHDIQRTVAVAQLGAAQGQVFDRALKTGDLDRISDAVLIFDQDEEAIEHILEQRLRPEADPQSDNPGRGDERPERHTDRAQKLQKDVEADQRIDGGVHNARHRSELCGPAAVADQRICPATQSPDKEGDEPLRDEGDHQSYQNAR